MNHRKVHEANLLFILFLNKISYKLTFLILLELSLREKLIKGYLKRL